MIQDSAAGITQLIAEIAGAILAAPILVALIQAIRFVGRLEETMKNTAGSIKEHTDSIYRILDDHESRMRETERQLNMWNGEERRRMQLHTHQVGESNG